MWDRRSFGARLIAGGGIDGFLEHTAGIGNVFGAPNGIGHGAFAGIFEEHGNGEEEDAGGAFGVHADVEVDDVLGVVDAAAAANAEGVGVSFKIFSGDGSVLQDEAGAGFSGDAVTGFLIFKEIADER